jgi:hypothetical protein
VQWIIVHNGREFASFTLDALRNLVASGNLKRAHQIRPENSRCFINVYQYGRPSYPIMKTEIKPAQYGSPSYPVVKTGFKPAQYGSSRPSDGYAAGVRRLATSRYGLGLLIIVGCLFAYRHYHDKRSVPSATPTTGAEDHTVHAANLQQRVEHWRARREALATLLQGFEDDRTRLLEVLKQLGVSSADDIPANPRAKVLAEELREVLRQKETCQKQVSQYDLAILKAESCLRSVERQRVALEVGVSDKELNDLVRSVIVLEEKLSAKGPVPLELDDALSKQFEKRKPR